MDVTDLISITPLYSSIKSMNAEKTQHFTVDQKVALTKQNEKITLKRTTTSFTILENKLT